MYQKKEKTSHVPFCRLVLLVSDAGILLQVYTLQLGNGAVTFRAHGACTQPSGQQPSLWYVNASCIETLPGLA